MHRFERDFDRAVGIARRTGDHSAVEGGEIFARGLISLCSSDARRVMGLRTEEARGALDGPLPDELIHRDNLALLP